MYKFIYVFDSEAKELLEKNGFTLFQDKGNNGFYIFLNEERFEDFCDDIVYHLTDAMLF